MRLWPTMLCTKIQKRTSVKQKLPFLIQMYVYKCSDENCAAIIQV